MSLLPVGIGSAEAGGYQIERSLRFNSADSAYLNRTPASAGNRRTWTWSGWVKLGPITGVQQILFNAGTDANNRTQITYENGGTLGVAQVASGSVTLNLVTTPVYRDFSAWYHIVVVIDSTQSTSASRALLYINGAQVTAFSTSTYFAQNTDTFVNATNAHMVGRYIAAASNYFSGYLTEINFIDGQALTPSSFGETNPTTGVWQPIKYTGTYGTNGFYLNFSDNSGTTSTTLGKDSSGNGNNWTPNNFSVTAGAGNDSLVDTPTNYGTDTGAGGEVRGNYSTFNPLNTQISGSSALQNGNLTLNATSATYVNSKSTLAASSFNNYCEMTVTTRQVNGLVGIGVGNSLANIATGAGSYIAYREGGLIIQYPGNVTIGTVASYTQGDVIGMTIDATNVKFYKNNSLQGTYAHGFTGDYFVVGMAYNNGGTVVLDYNFGQRPFAYTAPSGFKALCTQNLPDPTIKKGGEYFNTVLYTGNNSTNTITGLDFQPDLVWIKGRSQSSNNVLQDAIRGAAKYLISNSTGAEGTDGSLTSFNSNGFTLTTDAGVSFNANGTTYVAWNWKANGAGSSNTAGTITSTVSVNTTSGFSIVTYTGNGSSSPYPTVGHGLGVAPKIYIVKDRSATGQWVFQHSLVDGSSDYLYLDSTAANDNSILPLPTSTVMTVGGSAENTNGNNYVAYCFAPVSGYSSAFSFTGNGSADGSFVFLGFRPAWVLIKRTDTTSNWTILDFARIGYNVDNNPLYPNLSNAEATTDLADLLSNGFKLRTTDASVNASGGTYIGFAVAQNPFKHSLGR